MFLNKANFTEASFLYFKNFRLLKKHTLLQEKFVYYVQEKFSVKFSARSEISKILKIWNTVIFNEGAFLEEFGAMNKLQKSVPYKDCGI